MPLPHGALSPFINGEFVHIAKPERSFEALNPQCPNETLAIAIWSKELVDGLIAGMRSAQANFSLLGLAQRLTLVEKFAASILENRDEFKSQLMLELGRSRAAVDEEWRLCEYMLKGLAGFCRKVLAEQTDEAGWSWAYAPVGICLISANVSLPLFSLLSSALPSLVAGNAVCLRPSQHALLSSSLLASCAFHAKLPPGLFQLIYGDLEVYRRLILTGQFDCVLYCGGDESLEQIRRDLSGNHNTRIVLSGGGKNASVVLSSADVEMAANHVVYGATVDCGQRLEATGLAFVHQSVLDAFVSHLVSLVKNMPIGVKANLGNGNEHVMGPLCGANSFERFLRFQGIAARESAETLRWGKPIDNAGNGYFVSPGVHLLSLDKVEKSVYASNAFFGPDVCVVPFEDPLDVVKMLNRMKSARVASLHGANPEDAQALRRQCIVPGFNWNTPTTSVDPFLPSVGRGLAGNSYVTGMRFLFNTVYPRSLSFSKNHFVNELLGVSEKIATKASLVLLFLAIALSAIFSCASYADYKKSVDGNEVVKGKFYPRANRFQLGIGGGGILNQSFINTYMASGYLTYHFSEWHAVSAEGFYGVSSDRNQRTCVENFYKDTVRTAAYGATTKCDPNKEDVTTPRNDATDKEAYGNEYNDQKEGLQKNAPFERKPAYMPIRQIKSMAMLNYQWTPVYGKALWFLSSVGYMDLFANVGVGVAMSDYYPLQDTLVSGELAIEGTANPNEYGIEGRPVPESQTSPTMSLGIGTRFFFLKHMLVDVNLRNFTVLAQTGQSSFMNFIAMWGGVGVLF